MTKQTHIITFGITEAEYFKLMRLKGPNPSWKDFFMRLLEKVE